MEIDSKNKEETVPSPPSTVKRETVIDPVDPIAPADVPRDNAVGQKRHACARQTVGGRGTCSSSWYISREQKTTEIFELCFIHEPHH
jgi:hypothetical protein